MTPQEYYNQLRIEKRNFYSGISRVYCPCLKDYVYFTSDGFHHLLYETSGRGRKVQERIYKLRLLPLVIPVIKNAKGIEEYRDGLKIKISRKKKDPPEVVDYWALMEFAGQELTKIKVILLKRGNGRIIFWSVMKP